MSNKTAEKIMIILAILVCGVCVFIFSRLDEMEAQKAAQDRVPSQADSPTPAVPGKPY